MIKTEFMELYEELSELNEVKEVRSFDAGSEEQFYHFYEDLSDLVNSLKTRRIYSNKNAQASQLDVFAQPNTSYVCMTVGAEGKKRTTNNFGTRSFGIAFKDLDALCKREQYIFEAGEDGEYSQFLAKTQYNLAKTGKETKGLPTQSSDDESVRGFRDFELLAIGQLATGEYFISGGQGRNLNNYWGSKLFTNEALYQTLRKWFMYNMKDRWRGRDGRPKHDAQSISAMAAQPHIYYHFIDNNIGGPRPGHPEDIYENKKGKHYINTSGQLNAEYLPRPDELGGNTYECAMDFNPKIKKVDFKEIIGVGPFKVQDANGEVVLQMDLCTPGLKGGYNPPKLFSTLAGSSDFADTDNYIPGRKSPLQTIGNLESRPEHLHMSGETAKAIAELYNESEHRVYVPDKKDMIFKPEDIETIILPAHIITYGRREYDIQMLMRAIAYGVIQDYSDKESFMDSLRAAKVIGPKIRDMTDLVYNNLTMLIQLLTTDYDHVLVELIDQNGGTVTTLSLQTAYSISGNADPLTITPEGEYTNSEAHLRYVPEDDIANFNIMQQLGETEEVWWKGVKSVIGWIEALGGKARLGAETILIGKDADGRKYVLFVDNAHKAKVFLELPGGGLHNAPVKEADFKAIAEQRLHFKAGISAQHISNLTDTGKGLLLREKGTGKGSKGVAKDKSITWPWSYYKLFTAYYTKVIEPKDIDYSFDNRQLDISKADGEEGYTCYLKWIPVDALDYNRALLSRYSNIYNIIRSL